jgi:hypothetical protein
MPVQQQAPSLSKRLGGLIAEANEEHKDKPVDLGMRNLPAGIRNATARLEVMTYKEQLRDDGKVPKGEIYFFAQAVVTAPETFKGEKIEGLHTFLRIPMCKVPAKGKRKEVSFSENWYDFQNLFKLLGIPAPNETKQTDPLGQRTDQYYLAAMKTLTDPQRQPTYISFSTRGWTPPKTPDNPDPKEMVIEEWHGLSEGNGVLDPASHVDVQPPINPPTPTPMNTPPSDRPFNEFPEQAPPTIGKNGAVPTQSAGPMDVADEVASLVESAMMDPNGETPDGTAAITRLEDLAWSNGWSKEVVKNAADWAAVGEMCLTKPTPPEAPPATPPTVNPPTAAPAPTTPTVTPGAKFKFAKRKKDGTKLTNKAGEPFPAQEVEVVTVNLTNKTCTLRTVKDSKDVLDIATKQPVVVKFEWLE